MDQNALLIRAADAEHSFSGNLASHIQQTYGMQEVLGIIATTMLGIGGVGFLIPLADPFPILPILPMRLAVLLTSQTLLTSMTLPERRTDEAGKNSRW